METDKKKGSASVAGIPEELYETYRMQIRYICRWGEKEQLVELYREIRRQYGDTGDLRNLDSLYNLKWPLLAKNAGSLEDIKENEGGDKP